MQLMRVNMEDLTIKIEEIPPKYEKLGGRGLTSTIIFEEVDPKCDPLGKENKLIFSTGLLTATPCPNSGRLSIGAKSPLTGGIKESNCGGRFSYEMAIKGIQAIILENQPLSSDLYVLYISELENKILKQNDLKSLKNYELNEKIKKEFGKNTCHVSIGVAGELKLKASSIASTDLEGYPDRFAGRGGLGAVMGSKGLKAIIIKRDTKKSRVVINDLNKFKEISYPYASHLMETRKIFSKFGTPLIISTANDVGGMPTKNFSIGSFEKVNNIRAEKLHDIIIKRKGKYGLPCSPGCVIKCSNVYKDKKGNRLTKVEYETIVMNGPNLMIDNYDDIVELNWLENDLGLDTIETGAALGVAMEGGLLQWGDAEAAKKILNEIPSKAKNGLLIGNGAVAVGKQLEVVRIPASKGQAFPAYDPRIFKGLSITYMTSSMGADHTSGAAIPGRGGIYKNKDYGTLEDNVGKVDLSRELQWLIAFIDSTGCCYFIYSGEILNFYSKLLNIKNGWNITWEDLLEIGKKITRIEREFNLKAGIEPINKLPEFFYREKLPPTRRFYDLNHSEIEKIWD
ncbi:MAG: aldehyde ferredoxin oxidoreductase [Candidatus Lokiarchaeota archaeon]|nr:aldehyde ferredoxin oxidoreductase [Candidatus Lokiarchaeota archaeon]